MVDELVILDYGMGNLRSVQKAFERLGTAAVITGDANRASEARRLVLPGVGAFRDAIAKVREARLDEIISRHIAADRPFLGICLGMQLLFSEGLEDGEHRGLDLIPGTVQRLPAGADKVPHMGWNTVRPAGASGAFSFLPEPAWVYFVHSYYADPKDSAVVALTCDYAGLRFAAGVARGRLWATQFHPEKSQKVGLSILHTFLTLC